MIVHVINVFNVLIISCSEFKHVRIKTYNKCLNEIALYLVAPVYMH